VGTCGVDPVMVGESPVVDLAGIQGGDQRGNGSAGVLVGTL
jgi:hypothetical protein